MFPRAIRCFATVLLIFAVSVVANAEPLRFANIFNNDMVIQQEKPVSVWGWATPGAEVKVAIALQKEGDVAIEATESDEYSVTMTYVEKKIPSFKTQDVTVTADAKGKWIATLAPMKATFQPKKITISSGYESNMLIDVLVGEVWVCSGQSNMSWGNYFAKPLVAPGAMYSGIRYCRINDSWYKPLDDLKQRPDWQTCSPQTAGRFSAIPFIFAMNLHRYLKVPVGIIDNSRGGTNGISWTSRTALEKINDPVIDDDLKKYDEETATWETEAGRAAVLEESKQKYQAQLKAFEEKKARALSKGLPAPRAPRPARPPVDPRAGWSPPAGLYNAMVHPLERLTIRGALYYQGEGEGNWSERWIQYREIFPSIIATYRKTFDNEKLPLGIIGLAGWGDINSPPEKECAWGRFAVIRDIHRRTHLATPGTGLISTYDAGNQFIHFNWKRPVGERAARWALATVYGQTKIVHRGHRYKSMEIKGDRIHLSFEMDPALEPHEKGAGPNWRTLPSTTDGFSEKSIQFKGFVIAGKDRRWYPAEVRQNVKEEVLEVWSDFVPEPVAVRYGWACWPNGNACDHNSRLPIPTFRTDDWPVPTSYAEAAEWEKKGLEQAEDRRLRTALKELKECAKGQALLQENEACRKAVEQLEKVIEK